MSAPDKLKDVDRCRDIIGNSLLTVPRICVIDTARGGQIGFVSCICNSNCYRQQLLYVISEAILFLPKDYFEYFLPFIDWQNYMSFLRNLLWVFYSFFYIYFVTNGTYISYDYQCREHDMFLDY